MQENAHGNLYFGFHVNSRKKHLDQWASSGIGAALAIELASHGANLILSARRVDRLEEVRARCTRPDDHISIPRDVTHPETHEAAFGKILEHFGRLDMLVLNSGIGQRSAIPKLPMK